MSHADKVREAKDVLVEAACIWHREEAGAWEPEQKALAAAIDEYEALHAATCPVCNGEGRAWVRRGNGNIVHRGRCPAKCDDGRRR